MMVSQPAWTGGRSVGENVAESSECHVPAVLASAGVSGCQRAGQPNEAIFGM